MLLDGVPNLEFHSYGNGTHGGGLTYRNGAPLGRWTDRFVEWFADCTNDGIVDFQQILDGELADENGNGIPDVCEDATLDVPEEFPTIASAIDAAVEGDLILVAPGVYNEAIDFQGKAIRVEALAGFGETVIDGTGLTTSIVTMVNGEDEDSVLSGFTIANGTSGSAYPGNPSKLVGGALFLLEASPIIENCLIRDNSALDGGAAFLYISDATIDSCVFIENSAAEDGGAMQMNFSTAEVIDCVFDLNTAGGWGGAVHAHVGAPRFTNSTFTENSAVVDGGAMVIVMTMPFGGDVYVTGCTIVGNHAGESGGGILIEGSSFDVRLANNTICDNEPDDVSGLWIDEGGNSFCDCVGDLDGSGAVDGADLTQVLGKWGPCGDGSCEGDLTGEAKKVQAA